MRFNRIIIRPYAESNSADLMVKTLKDMGVDTKQIFSSNYEPKPGDFIINWGAGYSPSWIPLESNVLLNHWDAVYNSVRKVRSFMNFENANIPIPEWTIRQGEAIGWAKHGWVVVRRTEQGYDGDGLSIAKGPHEIVTAPLYTKFIPEIKREYRAYMFKDELIDLLYKYKGEKCKHDLIRTEGNGWEYGRSSYYITPEIKELAKQALRANKLDFGGVDIVETQNKKLFVLETNSAPGIGKITAIRFSDAIRKAAAL